MAICHFDVKAVSRASGRSAVAAAAYRSGQCLTNERDGVTHDYEKRSGVVTSFVIAPSGAEWATDRSALWNAAEAAEKRKDAKVAREYVVAIPHELDVAAREELVRNFAASIVERYGVAADVAIHAPGREGDSRNHHAHILTTTRTVEEQGLGPKTRQLDVKDSSALEVKALRELWAEKCNQSLERNHQQERVDHRSYVEQGLERVPGVHLGHVATAIERREERKAQEEGREYEPITARGQQNAAALNGNGVLESARRLVQEAEKAIERAKAAAKEVVDWFGTLARSVGQKSLDQDQAAKEAKAAREHKEAVERAKHDAERRKFYKEVARARARDRDDLGIGYD